jgi:taurine dioxygenase
MTALAQTAPSIRVEPMPAGFGAAVTGVALARPLNAAQLAEVHAAWAEHAVIFFPDQPLDLEQLEAVALQLGEFGHDPYVESLPDHPHIMAVSREPDDTTTVFGAAWHSDWSFQETPPSGTILYAKTIPASGGDTLFADGARAFDTLSPTMQEMLAPLQAVHSAARAYGPSGLFARQPSRSMNIIISPDATNKQSHPLVRVHPVTARRALFINPVYTVGIAGMTNRESAALLEFLFKHMARRIFTYRHKWRPHTLILWDNRCVTHCAKGGYDGHRRLMYRITLAGEPPQCVRHDA